MVFLYQPKEELGTARRDSSCLSDIPLSHLRMGSPAPGASPLQGSCHPGLLPGKVNPQLLCAPWWLLPFLPPDSNRLNARHCSIYHCQPGDTELPQESREARRWMLPLVSDVRGSALSTNMLCMPLSHPTTACHISLLLRKTELGMAHGNLKVVWIPG